MLLVLTALECLLPAPAGHVSHTASCMAYGHAHHRQLDDFDDFSAPAGGAQGDFLARERELLGDEFGPTPTNIPSSGDFENKPRTSFPSLDGDDDGLNTASNAAPPSASRPSNDFVSSFEREQPAASSVSAKVEEDDEHDDAMLHADINKFQTQYPDLQVYPAVDQQQSSHQVRRQV